MELVKEYILENWALILILLAFAIMLKITVFLDKKTVIRMYALIASVFALSIIVFTEFHLPKTADYRTAILIMKAIRYSATPIITALILYALVRRAHWATLMPAAVLTILNIISIFNGMIFKVAEDGTRLEGLPFLRYLPFIGAGIYGLVLVVVLIIQSNKQVEEIIPIVFLGFAFASGVAFVFVYKEEYAKIFCSTIAAALFVYYVFLILQLTKKDALTGLLNRQAYFAYIRGKSKEITSIVSIDMNGLKKINDSNGHLAGDDALTTVALCIKKSTSSKQLAYRIGGDEFAIVCRRTSEEELKQLIFDIREKVEETDYSCSIGYSYSPGGTKKIADMVKESDEMMYADKAEHYSKTGNDRRIV